MPTRRQMLTSGAIVGLGGALASWRLGPRLTAAASRDRSVSAGDLIPSADSVIDLFVTGDTGQASEERREVAAGMLALAETVRPRLVILTGDNAYPRGFDSADDPAWLRHFEEPFGALAARAPFYPCLGNHDHRGNAQAQIDYGVTHDRWRMPAPYHAFEVSIPASRGAPDAWSAAFFVLDTTQLYRDGVNPLWPPDQVAWVEDALRRSTATWKIVVGHRPLFSGGRKAASRALAWHLSPLLARYSIDFYLSGHDHDLELLDSGRGWLQVVSGAGSQPETPVRQIEQTIFAANGAGFVWLSLRRDRAWIQFRSPRAVLGTFEIERPLSDI